MNMRTIIASVCLGLLMWAEPASAQSTYSLTVSHHKDIALSEDDVDKILASASKVLQKELWSQKHCEQRRMQGDIQTERPGDHLRIGRYSKDHKYRGRSRRRASGGG